ncbi:MAG TPA: alpha/beta fold hydrolase [Pseudonocardia sp.]|nr:alpha/beta fold hydrolase [Pseudonocardia sp.]
MERIEVDTRLGPLPVRTVGDGPPVLAVHGLLVDGRLWDGVAERLVPHARVVLPDLPLGAHRRAVPDRARLTAPQVAGALVDVMDGLGIADAVVVGNDTGGALAQMLTAAHPGRVRALVLAGCDAFEHFPPPLLRAMVPLAAVPGGTGLLLRVFGVPALLADPGRLNVFTARGFGRPLVADLLRPARTDREVRADLTAFLRSVRPAQLLAAVDGLRAVAGRAAVVWGRGDVVFPARDAERLAALLGTTVTWLDDARTFVPVDRPDAVADAVRALLPTAPSRG